MKSLASAVLMLALVFGPSISGAVPFIPTSEAEIVETLPRQIGGRSASRRALRAQLSHAPGNLQLATRAARESIDRARLTGDPRELGQAQAALAAWWSHTDPPEQVRLLRATLRQSQHDFEGALADLDRLLRNPRAPLDLQAQAELTRAGVMQVLGRFDDAAASCERLAAPTFSSLGPAVAWTAHVCSAELLGLRGHTDRAQAALAELAATAPASQRGWLALIRAELAVRRGDRRAEELFREALRFHSDVYTLAALSDWLLDAGRPAEVLNLLNERHDADALLLRAVMAYRRLEDERLTAASKTLRARFEAAQLRGDTLHRREEALFALHIEGDAPKALALAQAHWAHQKEPADARLLVDACIAAGQPQAAEPVRRFIIETGYSDVRLRQVIQHAVGSPK